MSRAKDKMFSIRLPNKLLEEYRQFCEENSINISKRLRLFMERDLDAWRKRKAQIAQQKKENPEK